MGNQNWDFDDDDDFEDDEDIQPKRPQGDDNLVKQLRKAQRASERRAKELEAELNTLRSERRENAIRSLLADKGLNPKVAKFIPTDIDASADALEAWVNEYADVFGLERNQTAAPDLSNLRQIDEVTSNAQIPAGSDDLMLRLSQAESADDIISMIHGS